MGDRLSSGCTAGARASLQRDGLLTMGHGIHTRVKTVTIRFSLAWLVSLALRSGLRGAMITSSGQLGHHAVCLRQHHIVNNGQQSAVLPASVKPFFLVKTFSFSKSYLMIKV